MPNYIWEHEETGERIEVFNSIKDMDKGGQLATGDYWFLDELDPTERSQWRRCMYAPAVPRASFVDGIRKDLNIPKRVAQLRIQKAGRKDAEQAEISKEIKTLERRDAEGKT